MKRALTAISVLALAWLAQAAPAPALYDPISTGSAKLTLDKGFVRALEGDGVAVRGRKGAQVARRVATLPAAGGKADPTIRKAEIDLGGELLLVTDAKRLPLTDLTLRTKPTPLFAKVGGGQLKVAKASRVVLKRDGFGNSFTAAGLRLTAKAAVRLNKRLKVDVFTQGQKLGMLRARTQPRIVAVLPQGKVTMTIDSAMVSKLDALSVSVNPIFPAEHIGPEFTLPFALGSYIAPDGRLGLLQTTGAIEFLRLGAGQIFWRDPTLVIQYAGDALVPAPTIAPEVEIRGVPSAPPAPGVSEALAWGLDGPGVGITSDPLARTVSVTGSRLTLNAATAHYFNQAFAEGNEQFHDGELLGTLSFTVQTQ